MFAIYIEIMLSNWPTEQPEQGRTKLMKGVAHPPSHCAIKCAHLATQGL